MDRSFALGLFAKQAEPRANGYEERKQRQDRHVGQVAGVDEPVVIGPGPDPRDHLEKARLPEPAFGPDVFVHLFAQAFPRPLAPGFGREVRHGQGRQMRVV